MINHKNISTRTDLSSLTMFASNPVTETYRIVSSPADEIMACIKVSGIDPETIAEKTGLPLHVVEAFLQRMKKAGVLKLKKLK